MNKAITPLEERCKLLQGETMQKQILAVLPDHISLKKFTRATLIAVQNNPELSKPNVDSRSLFNACVKAASDGLIPDGREAALVTFKVRDTGKLAVQYMPMIAGVIKRARNSGEISTLAAHVVKENDVYSRRMGDREEIVHELPQEGVDRGKIVAVYAIAHLKDGGIEREWMTFEQVEKRRLVSRSGKDDKGKPKGIWKDWYDEKAQSTVIHRLCRRLPMSPDIEKIVRRIEEDYEFGPSLPAPEETQALPETTESEETGQTKAAKKVKEATKKKAEVEPEEPEQGELPSIEDDSIPFIKEGDAPI